MEASDANQEYEGEKFTGPYWSDQIRKYHHKFKGWIEIANKIERLYAHKNETEKGASSLLASLTNTVEGMLLSQSPVPIVKRRFNTDDKVARIASATLEQALKTAIDLDDDLETLGDSFLRDFFLVGRGTFWVTVDYSRDDNGDIKMNENGEADPPNQSPIEFISWRDYAHDPTVKSQLDFKNKGKGWVARRKWMTPKEAAEQFGDEELMNLRTGMSMDRYADSRDPDFDYDRQEDPHADEVEIFEIWCYDTKTVYHVAHSEAKILAEEPDPLHLQCFSPSVTGYWKTEPKSLIPIPQYKDIEATVKDLNRIEDEITDTSRQIAIRGVVDTSFEGVAKVVEGGGGKLIAAKLPSGKSINDAVQILDQSPLTAHLSYLHQAQQEREQRIYRSSGIPDIVRGSVHPNEKFGQSRIKATEAGNRIGAKRGVMARTYRDVLSLKAEIIAEHYSPRVLRLLSGFDSMEDVRNWTVPQEDVDPETGEPITIEVPVPLEQGILMVKQFLAIEEFRTYKLTFETNATQLVDPQAKKAEALELLEVEGAWGERIVATFEHQPEVGELLVLAFLDAARKAGMGHAVESRAEELITAMQARNKQQEEGGGEGAPGEGEPTPEEQATQEETRLKLIAMTQKITDQHREAEIKLMGLQQKMQIERAKGIADLEMAQLQREYEAQSNLVNLLKSLSQ